MLPDLESVRCFVAAATSPSFRSAAQSVALSPAAFGERIRGLEEQVGARLFERTTRRVELTTAGRRLLPSARRLLEDARRAIADAAGGSGAAPFALAIGTRFELGLSWLVPSLSALARQRPERTLHVAFGDSPELLAKVRQGTIDASVTSARLTIGDLRYAVLHEERYVFVATPATVRKRPISRAGDAAAHALLDVHADLPLFRYFLDAAPRGEVWSFARTEYLGTIGAIRHRVLEGAGVAVLPRYFVKPDLSKHRLVELVPRVKPMPDFFRLVWRAGNPQEPELHRLAEELRALPLR